MSVIEPPPAAEGGTSGPSWLARGGAVVSFAAPFGVALAGAGSTSVWQDDRLVARGVGCAAYDKSGGVWALLAEASHFVPLGSTHFRLAFVAALVLGAAGFAVHRWVREFLAPEGDGAWLVEALSIIASLTVTLSASAQREGAV